MKTYIDVSNEMRSSIHKMIKDIEENVKGDLKYKELFNLCNSLQIISN